MARHDVNRKGLLQRPFITGWKNYLFADTVHRAKASAIVYSIVETAKENGLIPMNYLKYLFNNPKYSGWYVPSYVGFLKIS